MKIYRCKNCGWYGEDIIKWEEKPRDEFDVMCPKCHYRDSYIEVKTDDGEWEPAYVPYVPTQEEIEAQKRFNNRLSSLLASNNIYLEAVMKKSGEEEEKKTEDSFENYQGTFEWYMNNIINQKQKDISDYFKELKFDAIPLVENPDVTQLEKLKNIDTSLIKTQIRDFANDGITVQSYTDVPILVGERKEEEINERTEWAISDVKKGVFHSEDYGVRGSWHSDLEMSADKSGLLVSVDGGEYNFLFNKRFIIEDMITVLQKCLDQMNEEET